MHLSVHDLYLLSFLQERNNRLRKSRDLSASHTDLAHWRFYDHVGDEGRSLRGHRGPLPVHKHQTLLIITVTAVCESFMSSSLYSSFTLSSAHCTGFSFHCTFEGSSSQRGFMVFYYQYISRNKRNMQWPAVYLLIECVYLLCVSFCFCMCVHCMGVCERIPPQIRPCSFLTVQANAELSFSFTSISLIGSVKLQWMKPNDSRDQVDQHKLNLRVVKIVIHFIWSRFEHFKAEKFQHRSPTEFQIINTATHEWMNLESNFSRFY